MVEIRQPKRTKLESLYEKNGSQVEIQKGGKRGCIHTSSWPFARASSFIAVCRTYSRTGNMAAFRQSSRKSDPDNPTERSARRWRGKLGSNAVSLSIWEGVEKNYGVSKESRREGGVTD